MNKAEARKRIEKLRKEIDDLRYRYHVLNDPKVTDQIYESLTEELLDLEQKFPEFADKNSPTMRVGGQVLEKFEKIKHPTLMLSLNNAFSKDDLLAWEKRTMKLIEAERGEKHRKFNYFCELKYDGLSISLEYQNGKLQRGSTRGDGAIGEDVSQNLKTIHSIPLVIDDNRDLEIRGECLMPKKSWAELNKHNEKIGAQIFANPRNAAAGSIRQLDPKITAQRKLDFMAWDIASNYKNLPTHESKHAHLKKLGFKINSHQKECADMEAVWKFIESVDKIREELPFGIDGVVVNINKIEYYPLLGIIGKAPRYAIAYKYPAEQATTIVKNIIVNVGRTGVLTPLAMFEPTVVAGSTVSKATLHNMDQIERLDIRIGDTVVIQKAGDVIPEVVQSLSNMRSGKEKKFKMPEVCPVCGGKVEKRVIGEKGAEASTAYYCSNPKCPAKNRRGMQHFVNAFEIMAVGPKILDRFKEDGLISDAADLFTLKEEDVSGLERFGEKSAENIIRSINEHRHVTLPRFIYALGILHVGEQTSEDIAARFGSLEKLIHASEEQINSLENIGPVIAKSLYQWLHQKENIRFIEKLLKNGVKIEAPPKAVSHKLAGKTFVITGTLDAMSRDDAKKRIKSLGGSVSESVSKLTSYLVVGADPGSKLDKAEKLGVEILDEKKFLSLIR